MGAAMYDTFSTVRELAALPLPPAGDYLARDTTQRGLYVRVYATGTKVFVARYRISEDGKARDRKMELGDVRDVTLAQARERLRDLRGQLRRRIDPLEVKAREEREAAAQRAVERMGGESVKQIAERWYSTQIEPRFQQPKEVRRMLDLHMLPVLGDHPIRALTRADVHAALTAIKSREVRGRKGNATVANRTLLYTKQLLRFAVEAGYVERSPADGITRTTVGGTEKPKERALTMGEVRRFLHFLATPRPRNLSWQVRAALRLILLTGQRPGEVASMEWAHVDLDAGEWTMPASVTKSGRSHLVHLSPQAVVLLRECKAAAEALATLTGTKPLHVLFGEAGEGCVTVRAVAKGLLRALT